MKKTITASAGLASASNVHQLVETAWDKVGESFEQFCLTAGVASLVQMFGEDADTLAGAG